GGRIGLDDAGVRVWGTSTGAAIRRRIYWTPRRDARDSRPAWRPQDRGVRGAQPSSHAHARRAAVASSLTEDTVSPPSLARAAAVLAVLTAGAAAMRGTLLRSRPSGLVMITLDTTRADRLPTYGFGGVATPAIDDLAAHGVVFEEAVSVA